MSRKICPICTEHVSKKKGIQCQGACQKWTHYACLQYRPEVVQENKFGAMIVPCPCLECPHDNQPNEENNRPKSAEFDTGITKPSRTLDFERESVTTSVVYAARMPRESTVFVDQIAQCVEDKCGQCSSKYSFVTQPMKSSIIQTYNCIMHGNNDDAKSEKSTDITDNDESDAGRAKTCLDGKEKEQEYGDIQKQVNDDNTTEKEKLLRYKSCEMILPCNCILKIKSKVTTIRAASCVRVNETGSEESANSEENETGKVNCKSTDTQETKKDNGTCNFKANNNKDNEVARKAKGNQNIYVTNSSVKTKAEPVILTHFMNEVNACQCCCQKSTSGFPTAVDSQLDLQDSETESISPDTNCKENKKEKRNCKSSNKKKKVLDCMAKKNKINRDHLARTEKLDTDLLIKKEKLNCELLGKQKNLECKSLAKKAKLYNANSIGKYGCPCRPKKDNRAMAEQLDNEYLIEKERLDLKLLAKKEKLECETLAKKERLECIALSKKEKLDCENLGKLGCPCLPKKEKPDCADSTKKRKLDIKTTPDSTASATTDKADCAASAKKEKLESETCEAELDGVNSKAKNGNSVCQCLAKKEKPDDAALAKEENPDGAASAQKRNPDSAALESHVCLVPQSNISESSKSEDNPSISDSIFDDYLINNNKSSAEIRLDPQLYISESSVTKCNPSTKDSNSKTCTINNHQSVAGIHLTMSPACNNPRNISSCQKTCACSKSESDIDTQRCKNDVDSKQKCTKKNKWPRSKRCKKINPNQPTGSLSPQKQQLCKAVDDMTLKLKKLIANMKCEKECQQPPKAESTESD